MPATSSECGLFREEQQISQASLKVGIYGGQGSGKSTTAALMAIALSKLYHNGAPVMFHDTENGSDFLKPIFKMEGVPLFVRKSRSFRDMCAGLVEGPPKGACVYVEDSLTTDWNELLDAFKKARNLKTIEFYHWGQIKPQWQSDWVVPMLNSPMHIIVCGRAGDVWENVANEEGKLKAERTGTKMKAEGEFGYEPNLLIEMVSEMQLEGGRRRGGRFIHNAYVLKDRTRTIQGLCFKWPDINAYKPGDYKKIFSPFEPHAAFFNIGGTQMAVDASASSSQLFDAAGNFDYQRMKQQAQIFLEEIEGNLLALWPGQDANSKKFKGNTIEALFGTRSWTKVSTLPLGNLEVGLVRLGMIRARTQNVILDTEEDVDRMLREATGWTPDDEMGKGASA